MSAQYRFDSWTTDNGLPQNGIRTITQSPDCYLWFTTFVGSVRSDGIKFPVFNKSNSKGIITNRFWVVKAMPDGSIWASTEDGDLTIYRNGSFISYPAEKIPEKHILGFVFDKEVLIETESAFYRLENDNFVFVKNIEQTENQKIVYQANEKSLWEIYPNETFQIKGNQKQTYPISLKNLNLTDYSKMGVFEDKSGGLWFADFDKLVYLKDGKIREYGEKEGYPQKIFAHHLWQESDGSLWFATGNYNFSGVGSVRLKDSKLNTFASQSIKESLN